MRRRTFRPMGSAFSARSLAAVAALAIAFAAVSPPCALAATAAAAATDPANATPIGPAPQPTPAQLVAEVERAWKSGDANGLAALCDSASIRIAMKPGTPPAIAPTLVAAAFLIHDQLDLVVTKRFQAFRLETDAKKRTAKAWARWDGSWGGSRGEREIEVILVAREKSGGGWLLTEIRAND